VINAGGMHNAARDILKSYDLDQVNDRIDRIYDLMLKIFERSDAEKTTPEAVAEIMAREISNSRRVMLLFFNL
jgi:leucine dehydrogenase